MSKFITSLRVEKVNEGRGGRGTWLLLHPLIYVSDVAETVFVAPEGFLTDFASVPRLPLAFLLAGESAHCAAVIHDYLYSKQAVTRELADKVFREAAQVSGEPGWKAALMWAGIRAGGWVAWNNKRV